jgi:hypothetical protein
VNVTAGQIVKLTITRAPIDDVDHYIIYRTSLGMSDALQNYYRLGDLDDTAAIVTFTDGMHVC